MDSSRKVLIISAPSDIHAKTVGRRIREDGGEPLLFDIRRFPTQTSISLWRGSETRSVLRLPDGQDVEGRTLTSIWWRRPQQPIIAKEITDQTHRRFALNESLCTLNGLWHSLDCRWVNPLIADSAASHKPAQLKLAHECGLSIPDTLITNNVKAARAFIDSYDGRVVYKALAGLPGAWRETRKLGTDELSHLDEVSLAPLIFQELIEGNDLRVTVVGDDVFAAEMDTAHSRYPYDIRMDMTVPIRPVELDDKTQEALHRFMQRLGLFYGACDFRRRPDGKFIFLEINPAGQFLHIEKLSGLPISHALSALLLQPL